MPPADPPPVRYNPEWTPPTPNGRQPRLRRLSPVPSSTPAPGPADIGVAPQIWTPATVAPPAPIIDDSLVRDLQALVSERVGTELRGREAGYEEQRRVTIEAARLLVREHADNRVGAGEHLPPGFEEQLFLAIVAYLLGLGPRLQALVENPEVENIQVNGHDRVRVEYADGRVDETTFTAADSDEELIEHFQRAASRTSATERTLSTSKPILHLRLPDGARLTVIYVVTPRPAVAIRRHRIRKVSLDDMVVRHALTPELAEFLTAAVRGYLNIMITGLPNSGKSTLLRAMSSVIPRDEWFATLETVYELGLHETGSHPWVVPFEEREGPGERGPDGRPQGEISLSDLFPHMLRMSMTRVIVGEVRAEEIVPMFDAMNTTHGSLSTIHARHPHAVFDRLAELLMRYGASRNRDGAYLTVANALDLIVFVNMERRPGAAPRRYVSHVLELNGIAENGTIARTELFAPAQPGGLAVPTQVAPSGRVAEALTYGGFDLHLLGAPPQWGGR
ncbi:CpaF family protein [Micromonospora aurantiaca (nom. illeg.)]|uniref:CpaF family protein n=1 Tax=Micromonospora aurantiaca (nom. illeg.) TaxID=47850 RepID=UPI0033EDCA05